MNVLMGNKNCSCDKNDAVASLFMMSKYILFQIGFYLKKKLTNHNSVDHIDRIMISIKRLYDTFLLKIYSCTTNVFYRRKNESEK